MLRADGNRAGAVQEKRDTRIQRPPTHEFLLCSVCKIISAFQNGFHSHMIRHISFLPVRLPICWFDGTIHKYIPKQWIMVFACSDWLLKLGILSAITLCHCSGFAREFFSHVQQKKELLGAGYPLDWYKLKYYSPQCRRRTERWRVFSLTHSSAVNESARESLLRSSALAWDERVRERTSSESGRRAVGLFQWPFFWLKHISLQFHFLMNW